MNGQGFLAQLKETLGDAATQNAEASSRENAEHTKGACDEEMRRRAVARCGVVDARWLHHGRRRG